MERILLGADHAGFERKGELKNYLHEKGYNVVDFGTDSSEPVDYSNYAAEVARRIKREGVLGFLFVEVGME